MIETGDFASCDAHAHLFLHGRKHDRMIIGGRNVYPFEIEQHAKSINLFKEVVVISEKHSKFGEIAVLLYTGIIQFVITILENYETSCSALPNTIETS